MTENTQLIEALKIAGTSGSFGVLVYLAHWATTKAFPQFTDLVKGMHKEFMEEIRSNRNHCDKHNRRTDRLIHELRQRVHLPPDEVDTEDGA